MRGSMTNKWKDRIGEQKRFIAFATWYNEAPRWLRFLTTAVTLTIYLAFLALVALSIIYWVLVHPLSLIGYTVAIIIIYQAWKMSSHDYR